MRRSATCDYAVGLAQWDLYVIRRVKISVGKLSRPAVPAPPDRAKDQLALVLGGAAEHVWAVSFIVTNVPAHHGDSGWKRGSATAPRSRDASVSSSTAEAPTTFPQLILAGTASGSGRG